MISFLDERYHERFFEPIKIMMDAQGNEQGYGFSIMALCSLLVESVQSYRRGWPSTHREELKRLHCRHIPTEYQVPASEWPKDLGDVFKDFFEAKEWGSLFADVDGRELYDNIRNGLLHQTQTKNGWKIRKCEARLWDPQARILDRDRFAEALEKAFGLYLNKLKSEDWDADAWKRARRKIWWLVELSR